MCCLWRWSLTTRQLLLSTCDTCRPTSHALVSNRRSFHVTQRTTSTSASPSVPCRHPSEGERDTFTSATQLSWCAALQAAAAHADVDVAPRAQSIRWRWLACTRLEQRCQSMPTAACWPIHASLSAGAFEAAVKVAVIAKIRRSQRVIDSQAHSIMHTCRSLS